MNAIGQPARIAGTNDWAKFLPRFLQRDHPGRQIPFQIRPQQQVDPPDGRPIAAQPLKIEQQPQRLHRFPEVFRRQFRHAGGMPADLPVTGLFGP